MRLLTILGLLLLFGFNWNASTGKADNPLEGLWKIHIIEYKDAESGTWKVSDWMKSGSAYVLYDATENMSIFFTPKGYETTKMPNTYYLDSLGAEDLKVLASDYWYIAKYKILKEEQIVEHRRLMHSDPNDWNQIVKRKYEINGDTLILTALEFNMRLKWIKEK